MPIVDAASAAQRLAAMNMHSSQLNHRGSSQKPHNPVMVEVQRQSLANQP
ncbi:MAG: hypothetical protein F6J97_24930 [Leptolyngbya sp. SIO4C1]|nr:hypothetical protein [Leptolyngbya sp. SIO4C1]